MKARVICIGKAAAAAVGEVTRQVSIGVSVGFGIGIGLGLAAKALLAP